MTYNGTVINRLKSFLSDSRGTVAVITGLCITALVGCLAVGSEIGMWYFNQRGMQNAADSAVIAAATNGTSNFATEAKAVAQQYGFTDGSNNVTVTVSNTATCPSGGTTCYSVTICGSVPLFLSQIVGYSGNQVINGAPAQGLCATSVAQVTTTPVSYCILALGTSGAQGIRANGVPDGNLAGCNVMSDTTATCNGHTTGADNGYAHSTNNGCGIKQYANVPVATDQYAGLASNIPTDPCSGNYPQEPSKNKDPSLPSSNLWSGSTSSTNLAVCGDLQLTGNVSITSPNTVLTIYNGQLDTNGYTLQTAAGASVTVIFTGSSSGGYTHAPTGGGILNIAAPSSGTWSGIAIYQDPNLTSGVDISAAGNSPAWDISGVVYLPHSSVTFSGAVNKASNGQSCFGMVVDNITINGTGMILDHGQCSQAGVTLPSGSAPGRGALVF